MNTTYDTFSAMQTDTPLAIYRKVIVGKVSITVLNPFEGKPEGLLLYGDGDESYVKLWDAKQLMFFEQVNKDHIKAGRIIKVESVPVPAPSPNTVSDEEIVEFLNGKFFSLKAKVESFTDTAPVLRFLNKAKELEKSDKIIGYLKSQISAIELAKYEKQE